MEIEFKNVVNDHINNISFKVAPNSITGIIGEENKSEITKILTGINQINSGKILIGENCITSDEYKADILFNIGALFDNINLYKKHFTVKKQLLKGLSYYIKVDDEEEKMIDVLNQVGLNEFYLNRRMSTLSLTEKKKIYLASILIFNPEVIILDNFELHFSYGDQLLLKNLLKTLKKEYNKTIIVISNNVSFISDFVDNLLVFHNEKIIEENISILNSCKIEKYNIDLMPIINFCALINDEIHPFVYYNNINELIKAVYRDVE